MVAAGAAEEDRELVADQLATTAGEDRRQAGQARPVLLACVGRGPFDAPGVRGDSAADLGACLYRWGKSWRLAGTKGWRRKEGGTVECPRNGQRRAQVSR
jgi:hypothetical protein